MGSRKTRKREGGCHNKSSALGGVVCEAKAKNALEKPHMAAPTHVCIVAAEWMAMTMM